MSFSLDNVADVAEINDQFDTAAEEIIQANLTRAVRTAYL